MTEPLMRKVLYNFLSFNREFFDNLKKLNKARGNKSSIHLPNSESLLVDSENSFSGEEEYYNDKYIDTVKNYIQHVSAMDRRKSVINIINNDSNNDLFSRSMYSIDRRRRHSAVRSVLSIDGKSKLKELIKRKTSYNNVNNMNNIFQIKNVNLNSSTPFEIKEVNKKPIKHIELNNLKQKPYEEEMKELEHTRKNKKIKSQAPGARGSLYSITSEGEGEEEGDEGVAKRFGTEEGREKKEFEVERKDSNTNDNKYKLLHNFNLYNKIINVKCVQSQINFKRSNKKFGVIKIVDKEEIENLKERIKNMEKRKRKNSFQKKISSILKLRSESITNKTDQFTRTYSPTILSPIRKKKKKKKFQVSVVFVV